MYDDSADALRLEYRNIGVRFTTVHPATVATDLAAGIGAVRGSKVVSPNDVGAAIVDAVMRPRDRVYVPPILGAAMRIQSRLMDGSAACSLIALPSSERINRGACPWPGASMMRSPSISA